LLPFSLATWGSGGRWFKSTHPDSKFQDFANGLFTGLWGHNDIELLPFRARV